jgi:hypothetical protein
MFEGLIPRRDVVSPEIIFASIIPMLNAGLIKNATIEDTSTQTSKQDDGADYLLSSLILFSLSC